MLRVMSLCMKNCAFRKATQGTQTTGLLQSRPKKPVTDFWKRLHATLSLCTSDLPVTPRIRSSKCDNDIGIHASISDQSKLIPCATIFSDILTLSNPPI